MEIFMRLAAGGALAVTLSFSGWVAAQEAIPQEPVQLAQARQGDDEDDQRRARRGDRREERRDDRGDRREGRQDDRRRADDRSRGDQDRRARQGRDQDEQDRRARQDRQRERVDREKESRERAQREKADRERAEKEKADRERAAREKSDRDRRDRERADRKDSERDGTRRTLRRDADREGRAERERRRKALEAELRREREAARNEGRKEQVEERLRRQNERLRSLREGRRERRDANRTIIEEGNRFIYRENGREFIRGDETERLRRRSREVKVERRGRDQITTIVRPNGVRIITTKDQYGRTLRRVKVLPNGRRIVLFRNRRRDRDFVFHDFFIDLAPPRLLLPRERYIVEADEATEEDIYEALAAGPIEDLDRRYTLEEVLASPGLRDRLRRVDLDTITFDFGSWEVGPEQVARLEIIASVIKSLIEEDPETVILLEGHTDAVGTETDNLSLSDRRTEAVATILTEEFDVPAENLVTQGYGEQFLKIPTEEPERENRRVTVRNITHLLATAEGDGEFDEDEDYEYEDERPENGRR